MNEKDAIKQRHSVRSYNDKKIEDDKLNDLKTFINNINKEGNFNFQLVLEEKEAFSSFLALTRLKPSVLSLSIAR